MRQLMRSQVSYPLQHRVQSVTLALPCLCANLFVQCATANQQSQEATALLTVTPRHLLATTAPPYATRASVGYPMRHVALVASGWYKARASRSVSVLALLAAAGSAYLSASLATGLLYQGLQSCCVLTGQDRLEMCMAYMMQGIGKGGGSGQVGSHHLECDLHSCLLE